MDYNELLQRIKRNDINAFEELFREFFPVLLEYASFYTNNRQQAEDIVQDIFIKIWESRNKLTIKSSLKAYLYRSVHNNCIQYLRHKIVVNKFLLIEQGKLEEAMIMNRLFFETGLTKLINSEIKELIDKAIFNLPPKTKEIFILSRNANMKNADIAIKLKLTEKAVEYHITRALSFLRLHLKDYLPVVIILIVRFSENYIQLI